jgi:hypothetical protein
MCAFLRWKIISDSSGSDDTTIAVFEALNGSACPKGGTTGLKFESASFAAGELNNTASIATAISPGTSVPKRSAGAFCASICPCHCGLIRSQLFVR